MIKLVTQGLLIGFVLFFCSSWAAADVRINPPIQLAIETDKNLVYQHSQLLLRLHIFHDEPLSDAVDIIPPMLEEGRVRTLGEAHTLIEQGPDQSSYHTTLHFALFPEQIGVLSILAPSLRYPSPFDQSSVLLTAEMPSITVLPALAIPNWLPSEELFLSDTSQPIDANGQAHIRHLSLTAVGTLPHQLPESLLDTGQLKEYQLIERRVQEINSRQGVTSQLTELWRVSPLPISETHPTTSITWFDTHDQQLKFNQLPAPDLPLSASKADTVESAIDAGASTPQAPTTATADPVDQHEAPLWLQIVIGGTLFSVVLIAALYSFRSKQPLEQPAPKTRPAPKAQASTPKAQAPQAQRQASGVQAPLSHPKPMDAEQQAFQVLMAACQENACQKARSSLILWAACFWPDKKITQPQSFYQANVSKTLNYLLLDLEHHIQQSQEPLWRGDLMLQAVKTLRQRRTR